MAGMDSEGISDILLESYPNPFSERITILFKLPGEDQVLIEVFDLTGKLIKTVFDKTVNGDQEYKVEFDGSKLPDGLYLYRMTTKSDVYLRKMMLIKDN
jgi:hypothetical protein